MKNIHVLPTDKPSRLLVRNDKPFVLMLKEHSPFATNQTHINQNIYITNSEEIKEGDWHIYENEAKKTTKETLDYIDSSGDEGFKKIILTTDQSLDGVQAIDNEFLEWFMKNPNCESVEVLTDAYTMQEIFELKLQNGVFKYKIIIPKEEPKQETLEEAAHRILTQYGIKSIGQSIGVIKVQELMVEMAKYQAERMYSEAIEFAEWIRIKDFQTTSKNNWIGLDMRYYTTEELFEQFKKK